MKPYCKDFTIKLKYLQTTGKLVGIHKPTPKEAKTSLVVPDSLETVKQYYVAESKALSGEVAFADLLTREDCESAIVEKDKVTGETSVTVLPKEVVEKVKQSALPKNIMNLTVHRSVDADTQMYPLKNSQSYVFYPDDKDPDNVQNYNLLVEVLKNSDLTFCSVVNLQNHEGLFRLSVWRDRIILVKQGYPEEINEHEVPEEGEFVKLPDGVIEKAVSKFSKLVEDIDASTYKNRILSEVVELKNAVESGETFNVTEEEEVKVSDLNDLLDAFDED